MGQKTKKGLIVKGNVYKNQEYLIIIKDLTDKVKPFLEKYWIGDECVDPSNQDHFSAVVKIAISEFGMYHSEMEEDLNVKTGTINEWIEGRTFPSQKKRKEVFYYIAQKI